MLVLVAHKPINTPQPLFNKMINAKPAKKKLSHTECPKLEKYNLDGGISVKPCTKSTLCTKPPLSVKYSLSTPKLGCNSLTKWQLSSFSNRK